MTRRLALLGVGCALALTTAPAAQAEVAPQPPLDITKLTYQPVGHLKPGDTLNSDYSAMCDELRPLMTGPIFNPSGSFNAHDTSVFETSCLPFRNQDDTSAADPWGNGGEGETRHGYCAGAEPTDPLDPGVCPNHQLEYIEYFKTTMMEVLKDFDPVFHEYAFEHPEGIGRNPAVVIAGADNPDEHILIGSHYDQTTTGPASHWDSQEGHSEMIRVAKLMADYWKATGTRPSATIKFIPMDGEEDGLLGSADYVANTIVPDQESKVRGYFNADPCAGGYPARRFGNPADVIPVNVQIGDSTDPRVVAWNDKVPTLIEQVFDNLDDTIGAYPDAPEIFKSAGEAGPLSDIGLHVFVSKDNPVLFGSDWQNFIAVDIPIFNPSPKVTGPGSGGDPSLLTLQANDPYGLVGFHTPVDNMATMSRLTGQSPLGDQFSEAYMKGMEMCSHLLSWGMLQPEMGGAQTVDGDVVAYYEATPNEAERGKLVTFDAGGSHQYADPATRTFVPEENLQFKWDLGDGTRTYYGQVVKHAYRQPGIYTTKLTVTNRDTGATASMSIPVVVEEGGSANEQDPAGQDVDAVPARNRVVACPSSSAFQRVSVKRRGRGLTFEFPRSMDTPDPVTISLFRASKGRRVVRPTRVARATVRGGSFTYKGSRKLRRGEYFATVETVQPSGHRERRAFALTYTGKRFKVVKQAYQRPDSCGLVSVFRLATPVFGGRRSLAIGYTTTKDADVRVQVRRGRKVVKRFSAKSTANRAGRFTLKSRGLRRGRYSVRLIVTAGDERVTETLYARKL